MEKHQGDPTIIMLYSQGKPVKEIGVVVQLDFKLNSNNQDNDPHEIRRVNDEKLLEKQRAGMQRHLDNLEKLKKLKKLPVDE